MTFADFYKDCFNLLDAKGLGTLDTYVKRLNKEMHIIEAQLEDYKSSPIDYFLEMAEKVKTTGKIPNSNNMLLTYLLGISDEDPLKAGKEVVKTKSAEFPDIDMDFEDARRDLVKDYVVEKYGRENVASIAAFGKMQAKAVIKDVARVKNISYEEVNEVTKVIEFNDTLTKALKHDVVKAFFDKYESMNLYKICSQLEDNIRHLSQHAAGVVIAPRNITEFCGLEKAKDNVVTCFEEAGGSKELSKLGLVKMDLLGLNTLTVIHEALDGIKKNHGKDINIEEIDFNDPVILQAFDTGNCLGVFQFERDWVRNMLRKMQGVTFSDIAVLNALNRPGPIEMGENLWKTKVGEMPSHYLHPWLEPILAESYGVICLEGNSIIRIDGGNKKIKDVKPGDMVLTYDGTYQKVLKKINNGKRSIVRIRVSNGEELQCTGDHLVLTSDGWKKAHELKHGDLIKSFWMNDENKIAGDDKDWLIGLAIADGDLNDTPTIACSSKEFADKVKAIADRSYGLDCSVYFHTRCWYVRCCVKRGNNGYFSDDFKSNPFKKKLDEIGLFGKDCYTKIWPKDYSLSMLAGFVEGDGCLENQTIRLKNKELAYGVYEAFQSFRIQSNYFENKNDKANTVAFKDIKRILPLRIKKYTSELDNVTSVYIPKNDLLFVSDNLKKNQMFMKKNRKFISKNIVDESGSTCIHGNWSMVLSNKRVSNTTEVYDLSVENNHNFVSGGLVVHNCYQEQGMEIAQRLAGFSADEADSLRKGMSSGKSDLAKGINPFDKWEKRFIEGCHRNGIKDRMNVSRWIERDIDMSLNTSATAKDIVITGEEKEEKGVSFKQIKCNVEVGDEIFWQIRKFAEYGFNKSHAVEYTQVAFMCMYLKHYYPIEFMASLLSNTPNAANPKDHSNKFVDYFIETKRMKIKILPPSVNHSFRRFTPTSEGIIAGLGFIKDLGEKAIEDVVLKRPYKTFMEFLMKMNSKAINKSSMYAMVLSGCFDEFLPYDSKGKPHLVKRYDLLKQYRDIKKVKDKEIVENPTAVDAINSEAEACGEQLFHNLLELVDLEAANERFGLDDQMVPFSTMDKIHVKSQIRIFGVVQSLWVKRNAADGKAIGFLTIKNGSKSQRFMIWNSDVMKIDRDPRIKEMLTPKNVISLRIKRDRDYKGSRTFTVDFEKMEKLALATE